MPRKTVAFVHALPARPGASMRLRPDAAENFPDLAGDPRRGKASMRPRPDAAENLHRAVELRAGLNASMRPRPDAAENIGIYSSRQRAEAGLQ